MKTVFPCPRDG